MSMIVPTEIEVVLEIYPWRLVKGKIGWRTATPPYNVSNYPDPDNLYCYTVQHAFEFCHTRKATYPDEHLRCKNCGKEIPESLLALRDFLRM